MRALPTRSPDLLPTSELTEETAPLTPPVPEAKVTAPASVVAPWSQSGLRTT